MPVSPEQPQIHHTIFTSPEEWSPEIPMLWPNSLRTWMEAYRAGLRVRKAEQWSKFSQEERTPSDIACLLLHAVANGHTVPIGTLPLNRLIRRRDLPLGPNQVRLADYDGNALEETYALPRLEMMAHFIRKPQDLSLLPPVAAISLPRDRRLLLRDGQTRKRLAQDMGVSRIAAFILPSMYLDARLEVEATREYSHMLPHF